MGWVKARDVVPGDVIWAGTRGYRVIAHSVDGDEVALHLDCPELGDVLVVRQAEACVEVARPTKAGITP
jgi:hypothetical protein